MTHLSINIRQIRKLIVAIGCLASFMLGATVSQAQDDDESDFTFAGYVGGVSDLRDRGLSLTDRDPAVVGLLRLSHKSGFYAGFYGATTGDALTGEAKAEGRFGYTTDSGAYTYDFFVEVESFHGDGKSLFFPEFNASISRDFGLAYIRTGAAYSPNGRFSLVNNDSFYGYTDLEIPVPNFPELTIISHLGYDARSGRSDIWDYSIGISAFIEDLELSLSFEDSTLNKPSSNGTVIFGARFYF